MGRLTTVVVKLELPYLGSVEGTWKPDDNEKQAAWEMYIELVTRVAVTPLPQDEGLLREALTSLHSLFSVTREILRKYGSTVAIPRRGGNLSFGYLAVMILNSAIRPLLSKWHPVLLDHESRRDLGASSMLHERQWERYYELQQEIREVQSKLREYLEILAEVVGVPSLLTGLQFDDDKKSRGFVDSDNTLRP